jgi:hypothetical protein
MGHIRTDINISRLRNFCMAVKPWKPTIISSSLSSNGNLLATVVLMALVLQQEVLD